MGGVSGQLELSDENVLMEAARAGRRATLDPGAFVARGRDTEGDYERLDRWQDRALAEAVRRLRPGPQRHERGCAAGVASSAACKCIPPGTPSSGGDA